MGWTTARLVFAYLVVFFLVGLVAVIGGLELFYLDDADWGSTTDIIKMFAWGLGLEFAGVKAFEGMPALQEKLLGVS
jgi:hypothetical protein